MAVNTTTVSSAPPMSPDDVEGVMSVSLGLSRRATTVVLAAGVFTGQWSQIQPYSARLHSAQICMSSLNLRFRGLASAVCLNCTTTL